MSPPDLRPTRSPNIAVVSAIIERERNGQLEVLLQTRWKPQRDPTFSGLLEIPAGWIKSRENVYDALKREVHEETGLDVTSIFPAPKAGAFSSRTMNKAFSFVPYCCEQQLIGGLPWVGFVFLCKVKSGVPRPQRGEVKDIQWIKINVLDKMLRYKPGSFFPLHLQSLQFYVGLQLRRAS
jgi:8-oxo-dGTP pyrophosphatase MutT (NUDIX family)